MNKFSIFVATGAYSGYFPIAPGTAGSGVGLLIYLLLGRYLPWWALAVLLIGLFFVGVYAANRFDALHGTKDNSKIVIDEVVGQLIAALPSLGDWRLALLSFVLFRVFDILKPPPAGHFDKTMKNGLGVMLDDVAAGAYALLFIAVFQYFLRT